MFNDWLLNPEKKEYEKMIRDEMKKLIEGKRDSCKINGGHSLKTITEGRGRHSIYKVQCDVCDYMEWTSQQYGNFKGYLFDRNKR